MAVTWEDTREQRDRIGDLEVKVLAGRASDDEVTEYRALARAHEAWIDEQPWFQEWVRENHGEDVLRLHYEMRMRDGSA